MSTNIPLAERMRPRSLVQYIGQRHLLVEGAVLQQMIAARNVPSLILWGPPGVGKTTLANIIARELEIPFFALSAVHSGVKDVRQAIANAEKSDKAILFIDEIHRFSKSQQDSLLGAVERGTITLIGATTENPSFEVISPLLSRCQVYTLNPLERPDLEQILQRALSEDPDLKQREITIVESDALFHFSDGDARKLLNILELVVHSNRSKQIHITNTNVEHCLHHKYARYDKSGEQHYDIISAFIKSIRGSDPNAALYWLARMVKGGEDPKFIARRLLILASEDIGNANPNALLLATNCFQAVTMIGMPECLYVLHQTTAYLAASPKSNSALTSILRAEELLQKSGDLPVPLHLRNAPTTLMKQMNYSKDYQYSHDYDGNFSPQEYLPPQISGNKLYEPGDNAREKEMRERLRRLWGKKYLY